MTIDNHSSLVPWAGLEPARANAHQILSLACLPIPPPRHFGFAYLLKTESIV